MCGRVSSIASCPLPAPHSLNHTLTPFPAFQCTHMIIFTFVLMTARHLWEAGSLMRASHGESCYERGSTSRTPVASHTCWTRWAITLRHPPCGRETSVTSSSPPTLHAASDRFDATLLSAFEITDGRADEAGVRTATEVSWDLSPNRPHCIDRE